MSYKKLYIIIGAGSGLGHEFAKKISYHNKAIGVFNKSKKTSEKNIIYIKLDIENKKQIESFFKRKKSFISKFRSITFINFATYKKDDLILNIKDQDIKKTLSIYLF